MNQETDNPKDLEAAGDKAVAESVQSKGPWRRPNLTIIDIRRTMLAFGSITDGFTGSL